MRSASLRQLRAFSEVARHQSFSRAAAELHLTPSAISLQVKELEQQLGMPLFTRSARFVRPTPAAEALLIDVRRALRALDEADQTLNRLRGPDTGCVRLGIVTNAKYVMPRLLAAFQRAFPLIDLRLAVANRAQLLDQLMADTIDLAVMGEPPAGLMVEGEPFADQALAVVASPDHVLADQPDLVAAALAAHPFLVREHGSGTRAAMERFFSANGVAPERTMEMPGNETIKQAVMANMGVAFLSLDTVALELRQGLLVTLDVVGLPMHRHWHLVHAVDASPSAAVATLREFILLRGAEAVAGPMRGLSAGLDGPLVSPLRSAAALRRASAAAA